MWRVVSAWLDERVRLPSADTFSLADCDAHSILLKPSFNNKLGGRNRDADIENGFVDAVGEGEAGMN